MELIGLSGAKGSGKNTAFLGIEMWCRGRGLRAAERGFADKLKWSAARLFWPDVTREQGIAWANAVKQNDADTHFEFHQVLVGPFDNEIDKAISGRLLLQRYGTEAHRDIFGEDFWVDQLLPEPQPGDDPNNPEWWWNFTEPLPIRTIRVIMPDFNVITDVRFENEAERIKDLGGVVWEVQRPGLDTGDSHASEKPLPRELVDKVILNDKNIPALFDEVEAAMDNDYHLKYLTEDPA